MTIGDDVIVTYKNGETFWGKIWYETPKTWKIKVGLGENISRGECC